MNAIEYIKTEKVFSLAKIARKAGVNYQILQKHINDGSCKVSESDMKKLAKVLTRYGFDENMKHCCKKK